MAIPRAKNEAPHDRPCAASGLTSYRYRGPYGWILIGAESDREALIEALRSLESGPATFAHLQRWDFYGGAYVPVVPPNTPNTPTQDPTL